MEEKNVLIKSDVFRPMGFRSTLIEQVDKEIILKKSKYHTAYIIYE